MPNPLLRNLVFCVVLDNSSRQFTLRPGFDCSCRIWSASSAIYSEALDNINRSIFIISVPDLSSRFQLLSKRRNVVPSGFSTIFFFTLIVLMNFLLLYLHFYEFRHSTRCNRKFYANSFFLFVKLNSDLLLYSRLMFKNLNPMSIVIYCLLHSCSFIALALSLSLSL